MTAYAALPVTPAVLSWARAESGYGVDRVASRLGVKEARVRAWENGERQPTQHQLEELAKFLRRPLGIFFLPRPPQLSPLGAEYRRLPGVAPGQESPELRIALRQMLSRRENAVNFMEELGESVAPSELRARLLESAAEVGARLRAATGVDLVTQLAWQNEWRAWAGWRAAIEGMGVFVFLFPRRRLGGGARSRHSSRPVSGRRDQQQGDARGAELHSFP